MPPTPPPEQPQSFPMTLEEFCARQSASDTRVELIAGFYADERLNGRFKATSEVYAERFATFLVRPA